LVGIGYLAIIAAAILASGAMIARSHWLAWSGAGGLAAAMTGYLLTRALPGGFLGDHGDVGNWRCPLGIAALSVETLIILLTAAWIWMARTRATSAADKDLSARSSVRYGWTHAQPSPVPGASSGYSEHTQWLIDREMAALLTRAETRAQELLTRHMDALHRLTAALMDRETTSGDQVRALVQDADPTPLLSETPVPRESSDYY
jgi:Peptidase family M41